MKLTSDEIRMRGKLDDLHQATVGAGAAHGQSGASQEFAVVVVELESMPVALTDVGRAVDIRDAAARRDPARKRTQPHGPALVHDAVLVRHQGDHRVGRILAELGRIGALQPTLVTGEFHDRELHAETDAEKRYARVTRETDRCYLALYSAISEATRDQYPVRGGEQGRGVGALHFLGIDVVELHLDVARESAVNERLVQ